MKGTAVFSAAAHAATERPGTGHRRPPHSGASKVAVAAAFVCLVAVTAGCSSSSSSPTAVTTTTVTASPSASVVTGSSTTPPPASPSTSALGPCPTSSLTVKQGSPNGYAGGVGEVIDFTNTSSISCTLYGYPGVSLVSGPPYTQIGLPAKRSASSAPVKVITLASGATASALLQIVDALNYPPATCGPTKATALKVYPPNQTAPVYLANASTGCTKSVALMTIGPVQAGAGSSS